MKVIVTGGSGFIGKALCNNLRQGGHLVCTYDESCRPDDPFHTSGSITDIGGVRQVLEGTDIAFHLAGLLGTSELMFQGREAIRINIEGTWNILEACLAQNVSRIFFPTKPNDWLNTYSITKRAGEDLVWMFSECFGLDARVLRWRNVYGPGQAVYPIRKAVPIMILQGLANQPVEVYGSGNQPIDLEYVDDVCRVSAKYAINDSTQKQVLDTGASVRITVEEMAQRIVALTESTAGIARLPMRLGELEDLPVAPPGEKTAASLLGDPGQTVSLEEGLERTVDYYRHMSSTLRSSALKYHARRKSAHIPRGLECSEGRIEGLVIILGSPNYPDGMLSAISASRVAQAAQILEQRKRWKCLPAGGFGPHFNTSSKAHWQHVKRCLVELGIEETRILTGINSRNTVEDACMTLARAIDLGVRRVAVVTSDFHMPRVKYWFDKIFYHFEIEYIASTANLPGSELAKLIAHETRALELLKQ